ncbi:MAG: nitroreductase [Gammaproteobacteria bacterium]|jgi:nitroreductase|uniref:Putative NAD(P)H nitroreductase n=1 Tax=Marinomonas polaris DSM 16579 TaxID=1122206 RepID=A0A1M5F2V1_9GAMM|nr:nitroreductase [Marinomonas polaris]MBU1464738.1 nitroreductase [Gammaproteobacteria bacterium]MBU2022676.1 nitroreductase [Gammaproteobacteria bacterium]MBU2236614.1 nitroreductase [Gammaproteobacteria bacterium]MBU2320531.1 nitroreductase [Gammaproteobacteria bacterium]MBU2414641.1 nitroreductase [Gammaproteobacteria bacterium]
MDAIDALMTRRSYSRGSLLQPAPNRAELAQILQTAMTVPDHGNLKPWRFVVIQGQGMKDLEGLLRSIYDGEVENEEYFQRFIEEIINTPMMICVYSSINQDTRVSVLDQQLAGAAACEHILLAAHAMGFGGIWHSQETDDALRQMLQMGEEDQVLGVISLGTPKRTSLAKRKSFVDYTFEWNQEDGLQPWK